MAAFGKRPMLVSASPFDLYDYDADAGKAFGTGYTEASAYTVTLTGSPWTYQNLGLFTGPNPPYSGIQVVNVSGGTVSAIAISNDAGTTFTTLAAITAGNFRLRYFVDAIRITYSVAPTVTLNQLT